MLPLLAGIIGAGYGWWRAGKRGGNTADKLQYAAAHGIAFFLVGYFVGLILIKTGIV